MSTLSERERERYKVREREREGDRERKREREREREIAMFYQLCPSVPLQLCCDCCEVISWEAANRDVVCGNDVFLVG